MAVSTGPPGEYFIRRCHMAQTKDGRKYNDIPAYDRKQDGKTIHVPAHRRSNPITSTGKSKGK